ncbi:MAG: hypothetical protein NUV56_04250 [Candidatus Uhrbacteria bacterium]|nr:hypothetical protein [Candidatus Uhrbacteria bacterium]
MENPTAPNSEAPTHSKIHTWIIILLTWIAVLSLATLAMLIAKNGKKSATADELATACQNAVVSGIMQNTDELADTCLTALNEGKAEGETEPESVQPTSSMAGFDYPYDWTAFMLDTSNADRLQFTLFLDPGFVSVCDGCDGPNVPIVAHSEVKDPAVITAHTSYGNYWKKIYSEAGAGNTLTNVSVSEETTSNGTMYTFTGRSDGMWGPSDFETIYFEGTKSVATISYSVPDDGEEHDDAWELIKNSLDFSLIE